MGLAMPRSAYELELKCENLSRKTGSGIDSRTIFVSMVIAMKMEKSEILRKRQKIYIFRSPITQFEWRNYGR